MTKISFAITVHNEGKALGRLLSQLQEHIDENETGDEIVILDDFSDDSPTVRIIEQYSLRPYVQIHQRPLERDFASQKNYLNSLCSGDWIFQIDADETLGLRLLEILHPLIEKHPIIDLFHIPRVNTVEGLTKEHIRKWGWTVNKKGWVMWPDYQTRLYKNVDRIRWSGNCHERITGATCDIFLQKDERLAIIHHKDIARQEKQNDLYDEIAKEGKND